MGKPTNITKGAQPGILWYIHIWSYLMNRMKRNQWTNKQKLWILHENREPVSRTAWDLPRHHAKGTGFLCKCGMWSNRHISVGHLNKETISEVWDINMLIFLFFLILGILFWMGLDDDICCSFSQVWWYVFICHHVDSRIIPKCFNNMRVPSPKTVNSCHSLPHRPKKMMRYPTCNMVGHHEVQIGQVSWLD